MAPQSEMVRDRGGERIPERMAHRRLPIALTLGVILMAFGAGVSLLLYRARADKLTAEIDARLSKLGVKPGAAELVPRKALRVRAAIAAGDFATADRITTDVLAESRVQSWRFYPFEDFVAAVFATTPTGFSGRLDQWAAKDAGALPLLFRAQYEFDAGWATRGHAFSNQTSPQRRAAFLEDMGKALADVNDAIHLDPRNPYSFYLKLRILHGRGLSSAFIAAFEEAIGNYPAYYPLYEIALTTLQPRWGGQIPAMYAFVDRYAGGAPQFSALKLLYLSLYRHLLSTASIECRAIAGNGGKTRQCMSVFMQKAVLPSVEQNTLAALQLYNHTDKYQFGLAVKPIISDMLATSDGDAYSGTVLEFAATVMHSDTQLGEKNPGHNDYMIDELVAESWWRKGYLDNARKKYIEAVSDAKNTKFPGKEEKNVAIAKLYELLSDIASQQHRYVNEIAYEKAAVLLGLPWDEDYICHGYYELKRYDEAIRACTDAIKGTGNTAAYYWRGEAYDHAGHPNRALADLANSADLQGYFAPYAAIAMTMIYFDRNDNQSALNVLNKYTFLYDANRTGRSQVAVAYNNRCYAYMQLGELKKALDDCNHSLAYGSIPDAFRKKHELMERLSTPGHRA